LKRPTRNDVAKLAGVSVATVSYVVNDGPRPVNEDTRQKVLDAIIELKYHPHAIARSLKTGNTNTIGLLVPSLLPTLFGHLVTAFEDELAVRNYGLILASSHEDYDREQSMLNVLANRFIDGLLYVPMSEKHDGMIAQLIESGVPVVLVDRYIQEINADIVTTDNVEAARHATASLIKKGCRRILCLSFSDTASSSLDRVQGYYRAHQECGLDVDHSLELLITWPFGKSVKEVLISYIHENGLPDGILCTVEGFLTEALQTLRELDVRIPDQVHLAGGFGASFSPWKELIEPPVLIIRQNYQEIAKIAVECMMERLNGESLPARTMLIPAEYYPF
jgi:LacI family transcriptional regulator